MMQSKTGCIGFFGFAYALLATCFLATLTSGNAFAQESDALDAARTQIAQAGEIEDEWRVVESPSAVTAKANNAKVVGKVASGEGVPFYDDDLIKLVRRLAINLLFTGLVAFIAHRYGRSQVDFVFTFLLMNVMVFFICFALKKLELELGMALGLFAIFGIIRYRTDAINVRDMTYLFVVIGLAVINALSNKKTSYAELLFANAFIVATTGFLEKLLPYELTPEELKARRHTQQFVCDDLELLKPENRERLLEHIYEKLGIRAERIVVKRIDVQAGHGNVTVHYRPEEQDGK